MSKTLKSVLIIIALLAGGLAIGCALSACGGGGGGSENQAGNSGGNPLTAPDGSVLPPDPGAAGDATLLGVDSNSNGVRDDVERYLAVTYAGQPKTFLAMMDLAAVMQLELKDADSVDLSRRHSDVHAAASACISSIVGLEDEADYRHALLAEELNTNERSSIWWDKYQGNLGGLLTVPPIDGSTCSDAVRATSN